VLLYFAHERADGAFTRVELRWLHLSGNDRVTAQTDADGVISTRRGNAPAPWSTWPDPVGTWELALQDTQGLRARFAGGEITDVQLVISYEAALPAWPA
jgi:hypothetical protein